MSESDTKRLAACLGPVVSKGGMTLALQGTLGAGKTTLVRYLVVALGGASSHVASPSYTLQHEYIISDSLTVEHWDLYRLAHAPEDLLEPPARRCLRIVEWPERAPELLAEAELVLEIKVIEDGSRIVSVTGPLASEVEGRYSDSGKV